MAKKPRIGKASVGLVVEEEGGIEPEMGK